MALFTLEELASYLQRDLDTATATLARDLATGLVTDVTGPLEETTVTVALPVEVGDYGHWTVRLPTPVVTGVAAVELDGETLDGDDWEWLRPYPVVRLDVTPAASGTLTWPVAAVTCTLGYPVVPAAAKAVALSVAGRAYDNPTGLRSESIDDYSATRAGSDADLAGLTLTDSERAALASFTTRAHVTGSQP